MATRIISITTNITPIERNNERWGRPVKVWQVWLTGIALSLPAFFLAAAGNIELQDGTAVESAFPIPLYQSSNWHLPRAAYADSVRLLAKADDRDGDAQISRAEAMWNLGTPDRQVLDGLTDGLSKAPASVEGWVAYATALAPTAPEKAAQALDQALALAPYDYFRAGARTQLAAQIWPYFNDATKAAVIQQTRALWEEPAYRAQLPVLLATTDGARLITRAYKDAPDTVRAINRWARAEQLKRSPAGP